MFVCPTQRFRIQRVAKANRKVRVGIRAFVYTLSESKQQGASLV